jgi:hypothetical protein
MAQRAPSQNQTPGAAPKPSSKLQALMAAVSAAGRRSRATAGKAASFMLNWPA